MDKILINISTDTIQCIICRDIINLKDMHIGIDSTCDCGHININKPISHETN